MSTLALVGPGSSVRLGLSPFVRRSAWIILSIGGLIPLAWLVARPGHGYDFYADWSVDLTHPYAITDSLGAFHYPRLSGSSRRFGS